MSNNDDPVEAWQRFADALAELRAAVWAEAERLVEPVTRWLARHLTR